MHVKTYLRDRVLTVFASVGGTALLIVMAVRAIKETGGTNAYALVAESLLTGTPWASTCFGSDCAFLAGKTYIVFPPFPGLLAMPLVWLNGTGTTGFMLLSLALFGATLFLWNRICRFLDMEDAARRWLLVAVAFASPLFYVSLRGDGVWFFAQATAFFFVTLALHETILRRSLVTAGLALGAAFLSRQMSIFYAPLLLLLFIGQDAPLWRIDWARVRAVFSLGLPLAAAVAIYLAYNFWRFGNPLDTGYNYIDLGHGVLAHRFDQFGLWNKAYVPFNAFYMFLQGFHAEFGAPDLVRLTGLDQGGTSILAASPWLILLFFAPANRLTAAAAIMVVGFTVTLLFYHSNGFTQYNVQRYCLDWLPAALLILAPLLTAERLVWSRLLILWGMTLNVATVAVLAATRAA